MNKPPVSVGILAGGRSSRMGRDKALLPVGSETMIAKIAKELSCFSEVLISAAEEGIYDVPGCSVCCDEHREIGPMEGIRQVLAAAGEEYVFICAADMPFVTRELAGWLAEKTAPEYDCVVLTSGGRPEPLCAVWSRKLIPTVEKLIAEGRYRLRDVFENCSVRYVPLESSGFGKEVLRNINTPEEYAEIAKIHPQ